MTAAEYLKSKGDWWKTSVVDLMEEYAKQSHKEELDKLEDGIKEILALCINQETDRYFCELIQKECNRLLNTIKTKT